MESLYLIPVEHQTLSCVVSVLVVLKKLTPWNETYSHTAMTLWSFKTWLSSLKLLHGASVWHTDTNTSNLTISFNLKALKSPSSSFKIVQHIIQKFFNLVSRLNVSELVQVTKYIICFAFKHRNDFSNVFSIMVDRGVSPSIKICAHNLHILTQILYFLIIFGSKSPKMVTANYWIPHIKASVLNCVTKRQSHRCSQIHLLYKVGVEQKTSLDAEFLVISLHRTLNIIQPMEGLKSCSVTWVRHREQGKICIALGLVHLLRGRHAAETKEQGVRGDTESKNVHRHTYNMVFTFYF